MASSIPSSSNQGGDAYPPQPRRGKKPSLVIASGQGTSSNIHPSPISPLKSIVAHKFSLANLRAPRDQQPSSPVLPIFSHHHNAGPQSPSATQLEFTKTPPKPAPTKIDQNTDFWEAYNKAGDIEDKEFVKASGGDLDVLLIFAGLFSATNTAFIVESVKNLKVDPVEETNKLLRSVFNATIDPSHATLDTTPFVVDSRDIRVNACFFTSLCCSLTAAFGAVLAKQWLTQYDRDGGGSLKTPSARGQERQRKYEGRDKWHLEDVIVTLPTLLQFSLFFFLVGLVDLLWPLNGFITGVVLAFAITTFLFYVITIAISVADESAPFQTRLSPLLRSPLPRLWALITRLASRLVGKRKIQTKIMRSENISCISYLLERVTKPEDLKIVAQAFVSLGDDPGAITITTPFIDFHLKPTGGGMEHWSIPSLCGPTRSSLLKILNILIKKWGDPGPPAIWTPLYSIEKALFLSDVPGELRRAFLADPTDAESCQCIVDILLTLHSNHQPSSPDQHVAEMAVWRRAWLEEDVTKHLENKDPAAQQNTLTVMNLATQDCSNRASAWDIVKRAKSKNTMLKRIVHSTIWKEISTVRPDEASHGPNSLSLLDWLTVSDDMDGLADALEALPRGSESVVLSARPLIGPVVETLVTTHLNPTLDSWWRLPGLHGPKRRSLLRILHVIVVRWKYLEGEVGVGVGPFRLNSDSFISSLRAELWETFLVTPEDQKAARMVADICKNLPTPVSSSEDEISITAMRKISADMSALFGNDQAKPTILEHCFSMLCSNADSLISFANFHAIRLVPGTSRALPDLLRSTMWNGDTPVDLEDFWRATFRVQLLPIYHLDKFDSVKFVRYLHLWFQQYAKHDAETPVDPLYRQTPHDGTRQKRMYWTYILSIQRWLSSSEAPEPSKELKEQGHQSHLLEILDDVNSPSYSTYAPPALHLFLRIWADDTSDVTVEGVKGIISALTSGSLPLSLISLEFRMYAESSRVSGVPYEEWSDAISDQVMDDMGQMMKSLYAYLTAAIQRGLFDSKTLDDALRRYESWCDKVDRWLNTNECRRLSQDLDNVGKSFKDTRPAIAASPQNA